MGRCNEKVNNYREIDSHWCKGRKEKDKWSWFVACIPEMKRRAWEREKFFSFIGFALSSHVDLYWTDIMHETGNSSFLWMEVRKISAHRPLVTAFFIATETRVFSF